MCPATEHEERKLLVEYLNKLNLYDSDSVDQKMLPDPLEIVRDSWMSESQGIFNWPSLYYHDIAKYIEHLAPTFISQLENEYKLGKAYRYFSCEFVREIFYFDLINTDLCILKSKVIPCQRVNNKPYDVWVILQKDTVDKPGGNILSAYCTCTAGLQGSCNHIVGMLFRVESAVATGATRPSKTSVGCQWNIPSGSKVLLKPTKAEELFFTKSKYTASKTKFSKQKSAKLHLNKYKPSLHPKHKNELKNEHEIRNKLFGIISSDIKNSSLAEVMYGKRATSNKTTCDLPPPLTLLVTNLASHINMSNVLTHLHLSQEECNAVENATHTQSLNPMWYEQRKGRLTASKFYRICTRADTTLKKKDQNVKNLVNEIMGKKNYVQTFAMKHGIAMEPHAKRKLIEVFKETHKQVVSEEVGLFISPEYPHLGASPDLILNCKCCGQYVVEIKCPESIKTTTPSSQNLNYLESDGSITKLKERHGYYFQIQGQMGITKINKAIFFVYTHHGYIIQKIDFDFELWKQMLIKFNYFWSKYIAPEILAGSRGSYSSINKDLKSKPVASLLKDKNVNNINLSEYDCGVCLKCLTEQPKTPTDDSISCSICKKWFHVSCVNVTEDQFNSRQFSWICPLCLAVDFAINT